MHVSRTVPAANLGVQWAAHIADEETRGGGGRRERTARKTSKQRESER